MAGFNQSMFILFELFKGPVITEKGVAVSLEVRKAYILMSKMLWNTGGYRRYAELKFWDLAKKSGSCIMQTAAATLTMSIYVNPKLDDTVGEKNAN